MCRVSHVKESLHIWACVMALGNMSGVEGSWQIRVLQFMANTSVTSARQLRITIHCEYMCILIYI